MYEKISKKNNRFFALSVDGFNCTFTGIVDIILQAWKNGIYERDNILSL